MSRSDADWCKPTVAVDLDMTLTAEPWQSHEHIGDPAPHSKRVLERFVEAGWQVVIYTCRPNCTLVKRWHELHYPGLISGINFNPDEAARSGCILQKPFASIYIDDKAWPLRGEPIDWLHVEADMEDRGVFTCGTPGEDPQCSVADRVRLCEVPVGTSEGS